MNRIILIFTVLAAFCSQVTAQDKNEIANHLRERFKIACLRAPAHGSSLSYDSSGALHGKALPGAITNGGAIEINSLAIGNTELEIHATRILFIENPLQAFKTSQPLKLTIKLGGSESSENDFQALLSRVLEDSAELKSALVDYWKLTGVVIPAPLTEPKIVGMLQGSRPVYRLPPGKRTTYPKPIYSPDPPYDKEAVKTRGTNIVLLHVVVNESGLPEIIEAQRSLGHLDTKAIDTVSQWRFQPATLDGKPVAVTVNIEVNFNIF